MERKVKNISVNNFEYGKIPPQAIEIEEAVLGAIIVESSCINIAMQFINERTFYKENHNTIFKSILNLKNSGKNIDLLTIVEDLRNNNSLEEIGGPIYIAQLSQKVSSAVHIEDHCKIIAEKYIRREFIRLCNELQNGMFDESIDLLDSINAFDAEKMSIMSFTKDEEIHINDAITDMAKRSISINKNEIVLGIPTGFKYYDDFSGGMQKGDLVVLAGETSNGKTTLALDIVNNAAINSTPSGIFSYEMTTFQLAARLVARKEKISSKDIIRGNFDEVRIAEIYNNALKLRSSELYIVKPSGSSFHNLKHDITRMVKLYGLELVAIDYLQLINNIRRGANGAEMIGEICNDLKALSVELNICTILISQLARSQNPRPTLSRLKGSGDIENAADVVLFTYLPFKYNLAFENVNGESIEMLENAIAIIAKGRNIGTDEFILTFKKEIPAFFNYHKDEFVSYDYTEPKRNYTPFD